MEYTPDERAQLLWIARRTLQIVTQNAPRPSIDPLDYAPALREDRACFVTFEIDHQLRGCTGTLAARRPLADEVSFTTVQTAFHDPRFHPVTAAEVPRILIEISVLTPPVPLTFESPDELPHLIRPHIDGVTLQLGGHRGTFLPQVWDNTDDPEQFLALLSRKMGLPADAWRQPMIYAETYQAVLIQEEAAPA